MLCSKGNGTSAPTVDPPEAPKEEDNKMGVFEESDKQNKAPLSDALSTKDQGETEQETLSTPHHESDTAVVEPPSVAPGEKAAAEFVECFKALPGLASLYLMGNPVTSQITQYRRTLIASGVQWHKHRENP